MSSGNYRKEKDCLNCGHHVEEHYCSHCGQPNIELKEPFWAFIGHSIGHYFHFDSKFFHTLIPLMTKPGQLTLDYLAGKRARYIHPVSLYIFVSIVYFLIVPHALEQHKVHSVPDSTAAKVVAASMSKTIDSSKSTDAAIENAVRKKLSRIVREVDDRETFKKLSIGAQKIYLDSIENVYTAKPSDSLENVIDELKDIATEGRNSSYEAYMAYQNTLPESKRHGWFVRQIKKSAFYFRAKKANGTLNIEQEVKKYEPKQYFLLMPLLAFFIMLNFRKNKIYYIDHLVFTIHGMTAFFIVSIIAQPLKKYVFGLDSFASSMISLAVIAGVFWYLYTGLKLFYNRSTGLTVRKTITVVVLYSFALYLSKSVIQAIIVYFIR